MQAHEWMCRDILIVSRHCHISSVYWGNVVMLARHSTEDFSFEIEFRLSKISLSVVTLPSSLVSPRPIVTLSL